MRQCVLALGALACLLPLMSFKGMAFGPPAPLQAQAESSKSEPPPSNGATIGELYQHYCAKCHGKDGSGSPGRNSLPDIPDFTAASWQAQRSDEQLLTSILDGKGDDMPAFARKIKEKQARDLVPHIRAFAPSKKKSRKEKQEKPDPSDFEERFGHLQKEMDELRRQSRELSTPSKPAKPSEPSSREADRPASTQPSSARTVEKSTIPQLFQKHCVKCHGADGTGSQSRDRLPEIPDFSDSSWQAGRTDKQIKLSILNGKGEDMPPTRGKVNDQQARDLATYIRNFASTERPIETEASPP